MKTDKEKIKDMAQYIDKAAIIAEIEKIYNEDYKFLPTDLVESVQDFKDDLLLALDTSLEVKGIDLEKEIDVYSNALPCRREDIEIIAKHFFELGLKVNYPITANDRGMAEEIIINLKRVEKDYRIDLTKEIEWLRNKTNKGE